MVVYQSTGAYLYRAWRHGTGLTEKDGADYAALGVEACAMIHARYEHAQGGWEWSWPIVVRVKDPAGKLWDVEVEREMVPEFVTSKAKAV